MQKRPLPVDNAIELRRRNNELSILNAIASALNSSVELDQALQTGLSQVAELLGLHTGWVWLINEETGKTYLAASQNLPPALQNNPRRMKGTCHCLDTYLEGDLEGAANVNVLTCSRLSGLVDGTDGLRYHASIPLYERGKKMGVLNVASTDWRELSPDDLRLLYTIGDLLSIAIERSRLFARNAQMSIVEERNRLAREIHDTLAQGLTAVSLQLESADALLEASADSERIRNVVRQALSLTRANLEEARRSVLDLRAAPLEGRTLMKALEALTKEVSNRGKTRVRFEAAGDDRPLPVRIEAGLYRIAQEALANVNQHAHARLARLRLEITPEQAMLRVWDNGQGFEPEQVPKGRYGLIGMNERARLLGGTLCLESSPGNGACIEVTVPLK
ncbi:MAG TPA: GAF domain-containing sensor histidine kinase [Ktedonobacterales bacterium]|nr:GAF domain-containing sensor histidine kinase [Ktedonobacterales bacterium]